MNWNPIRIVRFARAHRWTKRNMTEYLEGDLDSAERERAERHIHECPECTELLASLRILVGALGEMRGQPKRAVAAAVAAGVRERLERPSDDDRVD